MMLSRRDQACVDATPAQRVAFWRRVEVVGTCWIFPVRTAQGYARYVFGGKTSAGSRFALIDDGHLPPSSKSYACHLCRSRACVRPDHLYWGDARSNAADRARDGTEWRGGNGRDISVTDKQVQYMRHLRRHGVSYRAIAFGYGANPGTAWQWVNDRYKKRGSGAHAE